VILVDANLLLYAKISDYRQHPSARAWLDGRLSERARVGLPWASLLAFLRISTNARLFPRPLAIREAWGQVASWLDRPQVWIPGPTERHREVLDDLLADSSIVGGLVTDAHLAALALEHGLTLCSTDGDFGRFRDLRWQNPLR
jgi:toxin-antitoxin system PIN domain toxin